MSVCSDPGQNCLQRLSADHTSGQRVKLEGIIIHPR